MIFVRNCLCSVILLLYCMFIKRNVNIVDALQLMFINNRFSVWLYHIIARDRHSFSRTKLVINEKQNVTPQIEMHKCETKNDSSI